MKIRMGFVAGMLAVSGCVTAGLGTSPTDLPGAAAMAPRSTAGNGAVAATIIAAMDGGLVGGTIGQGLDDGDRRVALESEYRALEYMPAGQGVKWQGSRAGHNGEVVASQPYRVGSQDCRQYAHTVTVDGRKQNARGTACRNADGSWTPLS